MLQQFQQMQLAINEEKNKQINEIKNFGLNNQSKEELEALRKENKLLKEKNEQIEKNDLEKINDNKNLFDLNTQLNEQLEELNIETAEYKETHQLILKELSDYQEKFKDLSFRYNLKKSRNAKGFTDILEFNQMKLENTNLINKLTESDEPLHKNHDQIEKRFVNLPNKICGIWPTGCCGNRCIDSNISNGVCKSLNEYVNVNNDGKIKYNKDYNQKISWNDGDIFGCGVVFPSDENDDEHPYVFFTKNGNKIGSDIELEFDNYLYPTVGLKSCSVETNFGNDLVVKPFCYDISEFI
uniref:SPRY domain-containing protein n=1 Tax=Meloidogyne hapla TaxID=6305 RepID=A0A1I8B9Y6_MELHA